VADATRAAALDPNDGLSSLTLATSYNSQGNFEQAEASAQQALKTQPDLWQAHLEIAKALYGQQQFMPALNELERLKINFPDVHLVRGNVLMRLGRSQEGAAEFTAFLAEAPHDPRDVQIRKILADINPTVPAPF
jgi:tetratricopeptide (TPR) repeat protein